MLQKIKSHLRNLLSNTFLWAFWQRTRDRRELKAWEKAGRPVPAPSLVKRIVLKEYGAAFGTGTLVETGTYLGGTVDALKDRFQSIYSIELSVDLWKKAEHRFRTYPHIHLLQGDSGEVLAQILPEISTPCLFWLDGHYSGGFTAQGKMDTPIVNELMTIFQHPVKNHVILIDDARLFDGTQDYPTMAELKDLFATQRPGYRITVANDVIRAHPENSVASTY